MVGAPCGLPTFYNEMKKTHKTKKVGFDRFMNPEDGSRKRHSEVHKSPKKYSRKGKNKLQKRDYYGNSDY